MINLERLDAWTEFVQHRLSDQPQPKPRFGISELRGAVRLLSHCPESFLERWDGAQLLLMYQAYQRSKWDVPPHHWTHRQIALALLGGGTGYEDPNDLVST